MALDLASLKSVRKSAAAYKRRHAKLDLLINNAGIMMPPYSLSEDGFESQLAANYVGHFALTGLLLPAIIKTPRSRIVSLSSLAHQWSGIRFEDLQFERRYDKRLAYRQSKLACLMFAYELQRRLKRAGHTRLSVAAHPGVSSTNLFQHLPSIVNLFAPLTALVFQSAQGGAQPTLYAALGDDIQGGDYCGPQSMGEMRGDPELNFLIDRDACRLGDRRFLSVSARPTQSHDESRLRTLYVRSRTDSGGRTRRRYGYSHRHSCP